MEEFLRDEKKQLRDKEKPVRYKKKQLMDRLDRLSGGI